MLTGILAFAIFSLANAGDVIQLTDSDFADKVAEQDVVLVKFYAPWCGHCKKIAPEFERAATTLLENDPPVGLAEVDCTEAGKDSCSKYGVSGYPTLKIFKQGELSDDYNGPRDADGIVKYMRAKAGPSSKELKSIEDVEKFTSNSDHSIVGFFKSDAEYIAKQFQKLADALNEDFRFAHTYSEDILKKYSYSGEVVIFQPKRLQNKFEDSTIKYDGDGDVKFAKLKSFVTTNIHGLCGHRTTGNMGQFNNPLIVAYYDVDYVKNTKGTNYWRNRVMKVAKKLKDEGKTVNFAVSAKTEFSHELSEYGMEAIGDAPYIAGKDLKEQKFVLKEKFSMDTLETFVRDMLEGKLTPYLKSEDVPESNDAPVKVVVAKTFDEIVNDESKDVLIEFYAPWCGHCKSLAPKFDEVATKLKDEDEIVIAKMDATANDVPKEFDVKGFPTLFFSPQGSKDNPKKYEGGREVDDFIKYLARESTNPLKGYDRKGKETKAEL